MVEHLPDGSYLVSIGGIEYRALGADKMRELLAEKAELETARANITMLTHALELAKKDTEIAAAQRDLAMEKFTHALASYESERQLREDAMRQYVPGPSKGFFAGLFRLINSPAGQASIKVVVPLANLALTARR